MIKDLKSSNTGETINPNIVSENIPSGAVTTPKINDGSVTTDKIANGSVTYEKLATALKNLIDGKASSSDLKIVQNALTSHTSNTSNPHNVTKSQVGLENVDNTSDADKPISTATQTALDGKQATLISGTNIKTINNTSLLGSGNIDIQGGADIGFITLNNTSGTLTDAQYNECLKPFCIIKYIKASNEIEYLIKTQDLNTDTSSNAQFNFYSIKDIYGNDIHLQTYICEILQINKSYTIIYTNKQVNKLYRHIIIIQPINTNIIDLFVFEIISKKSTNLTLNEILNLTLFSTNVTFSYNADLYSGSLSIDSNTITIYGLYLNNGVTSRVEEAFVLNNMEITSQSIYEI